MAAKRTKKKVARKKKTATRKRPAKKKPATKKKTAKRKTAKTARKTTKKKTAKKKTAKKARSPAKKRKKVTKKKPAKKRKKTAKKKTKRKAAKKRSTAAIEARFEQQIAHLTDQLGELRSYAERELVQQRKNVDDLLRVARREQEELTHKLRKFVDDHDSWEEISQSVRNTAQELEERVRGAVARITDKD